MAGFDIDGLARRLVLLARVHQEGVWAALAAAEGEVAVVVGCGLARAAVRAVERDADARVRELARGADDVALDDLRRAGRADVAAVRADGLRAGKRSGGEH